MKSQYDLSSDTVDIDTALDAEIKHCMQVVESLTIQFEALARITNCLITMRDNYLQQPQSALPSSAQVQQIIDHEIQAAYHAHVTYCEFKETPVITNYVMLITPSVTRAVHGVYKQLLKTFEHSAERYAFFRHFWKEETPGELLNQAIKEHEEDFEDLSKIRGGCIWRKQKLIDEQVKALYASVADKNETLEQHVPNPVN